jgi:hypothetical protein
MSIVAFLALLILIAIPFDVIFPALGYIADVVEIFVLVVVVLNAGITARLAKHWLFIFGFIFSTIVLSLVFGVNRPVASVFIQAAICFKFFVYIFMFSYLMEKGLLTVLDVKRIFMMLMALCLLGAAINIAWGRGYYDFFDVKLDYRANELLPRVSGFQFNPNNFGMTIVLGLLVNAGFFERLRPFNVLVTFVCIALVVLSGSRVALGVLFLIFTIFYIFRSGASATSGVVRGLAIVTLSLPALILLYDSWFVSATLENLSSISSVNDTSYIRGIMLYEGFGSAVKNFPFGWGLATFGSVLSEGSPVYDDLGLGASIFVIEGRGIYDSSIASIMGELGVVGLFFYSFMVWLVFAPRSVRQLRIADEMLDRRRMNISLLVIILAYAFATPVFFSDYTALLLALVVAASTTLKINQRVFFQPV